MDNQFYKSARRGPAQPADRRRIPPEEFLSVPMPDLTRAAWRRCRPPLPLAVLSLALLQAPGASAQDAGLDAPLTLKRTPQLRETIPQAQRGAAAELRRWRPHLRPARPRNRGRRQCLAAPRRHGDPRRPARVLPARRPGQGAAATCASTRPATSTRARSWSSRSRPSRASSTSRATASCATAAYGEAERVDFVDEQRLDRPAGPPTPPAGARTDPGWMPAWMLRAATLTHRHRGERRRGHRRAAELHGRQHAAVPVAELSAQQRPQERLAAADHRHRQRQRRRHHHALLLEHRAEPRRDLLPRR